MKAKVFFAGEIFANFLKRNRETSKICPNKVYLTCILMLPAMEVLNTLYVLYIQIIAIFLCTLYCVDIREAFFKI